MFVSQEDLTGILKVKDIDDRCQWWPQVVFRHEGVKKYPIFLSLFQPRLLWVKFVFRYLI